jgi:hypothetical protein
VRVELLAPDVAPQQADRADAGAFSHALDALGNVLYGAQRAEDAYAHGSGTLQSAIYERARADVALSVATAAAQRIAQSIQSVLNMQV